MTRARSGSVVGASVVLAAVAAHVALDGAHEYDLTYMPVLLGCALLAVVGARRAEPGRRLVPALVAASVVASAAGDLISRVIELRTGVEPDVSIADVAWMASYPLLGAALFTLLWRSRGRRLGLDAVLDALVMAVLGVLTVWQVTVSSIVDDTSVAMGTRLVWAAYPVFDAVLLAVVVRVLANRRARLELGLFLGAGVACWLVADGAYFVLAVSNSYSDWLDAGWMAGAFLLALAAGHRTKPVEDRGEERLGSGLGGVVLALGPLVVPGAIEAWAWLRGGEQNPMPLFVATAALALLAFARTFRLLRAERRARADAGAARRYYARLAENSSDAVLVVDREGRLTADCPGLAGVFGLDVVPAAGDDPFLVIAPHDRAVVHRLVARARQEPGVALGTEVRGAAAAAERWFSVPVVDLLTDGDVDGIVVTIHDVTARKRVEEELAHQAFHDSLTGLANRALFRDRLERAVESYAETRLAPVVLFVDLDGFKSVNDGHGHDLGDEVLLEVARRLLASVRAGDTVARLGGDEFAVLLERSADPFADAEAVSAAVLAALAEPVRIGTTTVAASASIGVAVGRAGSKAGELLRDADIAMYRAKCSGKGRMVAYETGMRSEAMLRLQIETDLALAVERDQLRLVFQPIVTVDAGEVAGFEALLRWDHPTLGELAPDRFIGVAESTGDIVGIGRWVLRAACANGARWQRLYGDADRRLEMAVNVSARQLADEHFVVDVAEALSFSGLAPSSLVLEMTETALIDDADVAAHRLAELRGLGVRLAIDDFGTGYSSLSYLRQFPVDVLKIDRSFIASIAGDGELPPIVQGLLDLSRTLGMRTVAEGVEVAAQLDGLCAAKCSYAQGFLFARPLAALDAESLLSAQRLVEKQARP